MNQSKAREDGYRSRIRLSIRRLACWAGAWTATTALMAFGPAFLWNRAKGFTILAIGINLAVGVGTILANKRYLQHADELQRKVQLDAMGVTLGVIVIVGTAYSEARLYEVVTFDANFAHLAVLICVTYLTSLFVGMRRYR